MLNHILSYITTSGSGLMLFSIFGIIFSITALKVLDKIEKKLGIRK